MKKILLLLIVVLLVIVGFQMNKSEPEAEVKEPVKIGVVLPLTGPAAWIGEQSKQGMTIARDLINEDGGINGRALEIVFEDSQSKPQPAVSAWNKLASIDKVVAGVTSMSSVGAAVQPLAEEMQIPIILGAASHPSLPHNFDYSFRNFFTTALANEQAVAHFEQEGITRVAVLYLDDEFGNAAYSDMLERTTDSSVEIVAGEGFTPADTDVRTQLLKIKIAEPEVLYVFGVGPPMAKAYKEAHELGVADQLAGFLVCGQGATFENIKEATEGSLAMEPNIDPSGREFQRLATEFEKRYGELTTDKAIAYTEYDAINILAEALSSGAETGPEIRQYILGRTFVGAGGTLTYDQRGEQSREMKVQTIRDGKCVDIE